MPVHTGRLLVTPEDPHLVPEVARLRSALEAAGFLGPPLPGHEGAFLVGEIQPEQLLLARAPNFTIISDRTARMTVPPASCQR